MLRTKYKQMCLSNATRALALVGLVLAGLIVSSGTALARDFTVNNVVSDTGDDIPGDGTCRTADGGPCTLRAAIQEANEFPGTDSILFDPSLPFATLLLQTGSYTLTDSVTINGPTNATLTIDAQEGSRHFFIGTPNITVSISNLTLINGRASDGGSIYIVPTPIGPPPIGVGVIYQIPADANVNLTNVTLSNNEADSSGGAIAISNNSSVAIVNSTLTNNRVVDSGSVGGAIFVQDSSVTITGSTFANNRAAGSDSDGGAISILNGTVEIVNNTISGNNANGNGGAIYNLESSSCSEFSTSILNIHSSTIVSNSAGASDQQSGGIFSGRLDSVDGCPGFAGLAISNTILADNSPSNCRSGGAGFTTEGFNLITVLSEDGCDFSEALGDRVVEPDDVFTLVVDQNLADNGGPTHTHALLPGSPAIDPPGNNCPESTDQRGMPRPLGAACDIGAYEANVASIAVTKTVGIVAGACASTSSIVVNENTNVFYCVAIQNTGNITLTSYGLSDPTLGVDLSEPFALAPGAVLSLTSNEVSDFGPIAATNDIANTVIVTSTDGFTTTSASASATVRVPSIAVTKTVGLDPGCATTSSLTEDAGAELFYCVTIHNSGSVTLTTHTIDDPLLEISGAIIPFVLAPGAVVEIDNTTEPRLGPRMFIADTTNIATVTSTADVPTPAEDNATATGIGSAMVDWLDVQIVMGITSIGTDTEVTRTVAATVTRAGTDIPVANRIVGFEVTGGTTVPITTSRTNENGQVAFEYFSQAPSEEDVMALAAAPISVQSTDQITDFITVWVDLDRNSARDGGEPMDMDALPTAITLASFSAHIVNGDVVLSWRTAAEIDNAGFNLHRAAAPEGPYTKINDLLIPGQGTGFGATYHYVDENPGEGPFFYKLEDIDYFGVSTFHGPFEAIVADQMYLPSVEQP